MAYIITHIDGTEERKVIRYQADLRYLIEKKQIVGYRRVK